MQENRTTLSVSREVAEEVRAAAAKARLSVYEYVNLAMIHFVRGTDVIVEVKEKGGE